MRLRLRDEHWSVLACVAVLLLLNAPQGAGWAYDAKKDAKDFAKSVLVPKGEGISKDKGAPADVPMFTKSPPGTDYQSNPSKMEADASVQKGSHEGYQAMIQSMATRPTFSKAEIESTVAFGKDVTSDPGTWSGTAISGSHGTCVALPETYGSPGFYEQTCNTGYVESGGPPQAFSCVVPKVVNVATTHVYHCVHGFFGLDWLPCEEAAHCADAGVAEGPCLQWAGTPPFEYCAEPVPAIIKHCPEALLGFDHLLKGVDRWVESILDDEGACAVYAADANCALQAEPCTDSEPQTRMVSGLPVTLPCWAVTREYLCSAGGGWSLATDCNELADLGCVFDRTECLTEDDPCMTLEEVWRCPIPPEPRSPDAYICEGDIYCIDGSCDSVEREANTEFKDALVALNAVAQAGREFDESDFTIFRGERESCSKLIFGLKNCCVPRGFPLIGGCDGDDERLRQRRNDGLCTYVGTWCSTKVIVCLEKRERHCCYASKISRIIQEQGRKQLGIPWMKPKDETCRGLTVDEFSQLDLSVMDFSEVYADFEAAAKLPAELEVLDDIQAKILAFYAAHGP